MWIVLWKIGLFIGVWVEEYFKFGFCDRGVGNVIEMLRTVGVFVK